MRIPSDDSGEPHPVARADELVGSTNDPDGGPIPPPAHDTARPRWAGSCAAAAAGAGEIPCWTREARQVCDFEEES